MTKDDWTLEDTVMRKMEEQPSWTFSNKIRLFLPEAGSVLRQGMEQIRGFQVTVHIWLLTTSSLKRAWCITQLGAVITSGALQAKSEHPVG